MIKRTETDAAFRYFLQISHAERLPDPSLLSQFRGRLGETGFRQNRVVAVARQHGLVKDRLRLKDATHVIANIAVPNTLGLVAQARNKLLAAAKPFDELRVVGERINVGLLQERTAGQTDEQRLVARVTHLQEILRWVDALPPPEDAATNGRWQQLLAQREVAHKILADREHPEAGDRTLSAVDPDARCGKHGDWYDSYLLDTLVDPDSEIILLPNRSTRPYAKGALCAPSPSEAPADKKGFTLPLDPRLLLPQKPLTKPLGLLRSASISAVSGGTLGVSVQEITYFLNARATIPAVSPIVAGPFTSRGWRLRHPVPLPSKPPQPSHF